MIRLAGWLTPLWVIWCKEIRENLRDRRAVINALLVGPLLTPLLMLVLIQVAVQRETRQQQQPIHVPVIGARYAPELIDFLAAGGVLAAPGVAAPEQAVVQRSQDLVLRIPADYPQHQRRGEPAGVELIYDSSRSEVSAGVERIRRRIQAYAAEQGSLRLLARGIAPAIATPVLVLDRDQSTAQSRAGMMFSMLPYLLILTLQMGGMYLAIDLTAGERERQSLEPLLINPVPRWVIWIAKWAATVSFAYASLLLSVLAFSLIGRLLPADQLGFSLHIDAVAMLQVWLLLLPLCLLLALLQLMVASSAKSYREAQTWLGLLSMVPALPSLFLGLFPLKASGWMYAVPLLSQNLGVVQWLRTGRMDVHYLLISMAGTGLFTGLCALLAIRRFQSERAAISL